MLQETVFNWRVAAEGFELKSCHWRLPTESLGLKGQAGCNWGFVTEGEWLGPKGWDLMLMTEGMHTWRVKGCNLTLGAEGKGLQLKGWDWTVAIEGLQQIGCNRRIWTEDLGLKCCNWRFPTGCYWRVGTEWLPTKGCNRRAVTEVLQRKAWDWRLGTGVLQLKASN